MTRETILDSIRHNPAVTVLIIGAGINGIGLFRDLALQDVSVLIVDRGDFCCGASAASSHMIHGGIRYLENGEFRLVREAVEERNRLLENGPHYAKPLATTIPIFKNFSGLLNAPLKFFQLLDRPTERGALVIKIGLMFYDAFTRAQGTVPKHTFASRTRSLRLYPKLNPDIHFTATYYDGAMPTPERIALELILEGEATSAQARALNYVSLDSAAVETVTLRDELTGERLTVKPQIVVNAAGPWIDFANDKLKQQTHFIGGTKGSHLVLDHAELRQAIGEHEFFFENDDGRIVLIYPLYDKVLIGTSDLPVDDPDQTRCTDEEIDYFLEMIGRVFPSIKVDPAQIVYTFCGVRPLPTSDATTAGQISRDHQIKVIEPGNGLTFPIYSLIGGKWTTFRAFAEQATDGILNRLNRPRLASTRRMPFGGGRDYPRSQAEQIRWIAALEQQTKLPRRRLEILFERYGTRATEVAAFIAKGEDTPLPNKPDYSRREIAFLTQYEKVIRLDDILLRRTLLGMLGELDGDLVREIAEVVGQTLGWSKKEIQAQVKRAFMILAEAHRVILH